MERGDKKKPVNKATKEPSKRGRKSLPKEDRKKYAVGSFWFTESEKQAYDALYQASGMSNQTEFIRKIIFEGGLKLYFSDKNTLLIYEKLSDIEREISRIGININQATVSIHSNTSEANLGRSANELKMLTIKNEHFLKEVFALIEKLIEQTDDNGGETGIKFWEVLASMSDKS